MNRLLQSSHFLGPCTRLGFQLDRADRVRAAAVPASMTLRPGTAFDFDEGVGFIASWICEIYKRPGEDLAFRPI
jgi:hypothetical protein